MKKQYAIALLAVWVCALVFAVVVDRQHDDTCKAPCVVKFAGAMAEDNFKIDYRSDGTLRVWKVQP